MAGVSLKDQVQTALDETRILLLASQVFVGFELRAVFEPRFSDLSPATQRLKLLALGLMLVMIASLVLNAAWHRIVEGGHDRRRLITVTTATVEPALFALALVLSIELYVATREVLGHGYGVAAGIAAGVLAIGAFQGLGLSARLRGHHHRRGESMSQRPDEQTERDAQIKDRIRHLLTETRVVIPGAQALLGFQLSIILMEAFPRLSDLDKRLHLFSIGCTTLAIILLIVPAAWHRIVERGALTEQFHTFGTRLLIAGLVPLSVGLSCEVYVVVNRALGDAPFALGAALATFALTTGLWFGLTSAARLTRRRRRHGERLPA